MPISAAVGIGTSLIGGAISSSGSSKATKTQVNNLGKGIALENAAAKQAREDFSPFRTVGLDALSKLAGSIGLDTGAGFKSSPGYDFVFNEAMRAVDEDAANKGLVNSGARYRALQNRAANLASTDYYTYKKFANEEYFNALTQLGNLARGGATATAAGADATMHAADMNAKLYAGIGQAKADNATNQANIWGDVWGAAMGSGGPASQIFKMEW